MKKLALLVVLVLTLLVSSSVFADYESCSGHNPSWEAGCEAGGGRVECSYQIENGIPVTHQRCNISYQYDQALLPVCSDGSVGYIGYNQNNGNRYSICPQGTHMIGIVGGIYFGGQQNILPPVQEELLTALYGEVGTTPYLDITDVPAPKVMIVRTQGNRGQLRFDSEIIRGWTADLNMPLAYAVSKRCFAEAIAEKPMMYRLLPATMQEDNQYWLRCRNLEPIIVGCSDKEIVSPEELEELRIEEPWKNFIKILSHQGDPWAFKPIFDEDGNIVGPSPKLGFELK